MEEDKELKKIRQKMLRDLMQNPATQSGAPATGTPIEVTDLTFKDLVKRDGLVVIDCWAAWCAPCRMISPIIEELAKDYAGKILLGKLNVDQNRMVPLEYQIMSIPTILVFKNGKLIDRIVGAMPRSLLEPRITRHL